ncbi:hypothetical protein HK099_006267 [Clydaea vesicula]|uniref:tRNA synthetases class I catalytic domain-containing protein n=1 Tax=Clydaea vesicula TaxID=447962 RepID=A0AAD5U626_9FUNG|nr:hypothetical protein HK099_006267 [Clydaea vesicula]
MNRKQPKWLKPEKSVNEPVLKIYNSLTKQKEVFQPSNQRQVTWYTCGPTVYAPSHIGHARAYLTSDIIRKILEDYFNYNVLFVMNVTDIDDKIIIAARQKLLFEEFKNSKCALDLSLIQEIESAFDSFVESKFIKFYDKVQTNWETFVNEFSPGSSKAPTPESEPKYKMFFNSALKGKMAIDKAKINIKNGNTTIEYAHTLCDDNQDQLSVFLDKLKGHTVTDQKPFRDFARFYEEDYFDDMNRLGIRKPDIITRVTEYVPEIAEFVAKIIENKFAYEVDGSVYFDTANFDSHPDHFYAKLEPWSAGDLKLLAEGEGDLTTTDGKRNKSDFALWKKSKLGEPAWPSPWGLGRPGWHIECSVMASHVLGSNFDIHSGGIDLAFPHHDNEIAQSEVNFYF